MLTRAQGTIHLCHSAFCWLFPRQYKVPLNPKEASEEWRPCTFFIMCCGWRGSLSACAQFCRDPTSVLGPYMEKNVSLQSPRQLKRIHYVLGWAWSTCRVSWIGWWSIPTQLPTLVLCSAYGLSVSLKSSHAGSWVFSVILVGWG